MRTNDLKYLVQSKLETLTANVYHEIANEKKLYPHIVFEFRRIDLNDLWRQDYILEVDIWDKQDSSQRVDNLADQVENLLQAENLPQTNVLPTFYLIDRQNIPDEHKEIKHRRVQFQIPNYERLGNELWRLQSTLVLAKSKQPILKPLSGLV
jgi:hypothetical protein